MNNLSKIAAILAMAFFFGALGSGPATAAPVENSTSSSQAENDQRFMALFEGLNQLREHYGHPPIKIGLAASEVAQEFVLATDPGFGPSANYEPIDPRITGASYRGGMYQCNPAVVTEDFFECWNRAGLIDRLLNDATMNVVGIGIESDLSPWGMVAAVELYRTHTMPQEVFDTPAEYFAYRDSLPMTPSAVKVKGDHQLGNTVTAVSNAWAPGANLSYQWARNDAPIAGATQSSYELKQADVGTLLSVNVTQTAPGYRTASKISEQAFVEDLPGIDMQISPSIDGYAMEFETLTLDPGVWAPSETRLSYQWLRDGKLIPGANGLQYSLGAADVGKVISANVTATLNGRTQVASAATSAVVGGPSVANFVVPSITGTPIVGAVLTADAGQWEEGAALKFQWMRGNQAITGATSKVYELSASDIGARISVTVTGTAAKAHPTTKSSAATAAVKAAAIKVPAVTNSTKPTVSGSAKVDSQLTVKTGTWTTGASLKVQWLRNGILIPGATATSYKVTTADVGKRLSVRVTAAKAGHTGSTATTAPTGVVPAVPVKPAPKPVSKPKPAKPAPSIKTAADIVAADSKGNLWNYGNTIGKRKKIGNGWGAAKNIFVVDWNADGTQDLLVQWKNGKLDLYPGKKTGGFSTVKHIGNGWGPYTITVGKWATSDSYPSILARDPQGKLWNYRNTNGTAINGRVQRGSGWNGLTFQQIDWDKDGKTDVIARDSKGQMLLYRTNGKGAFVSEKHRAIGNGWSGLSFLTIKGYGGNGKQGVVARNKAGQLFLYGTGKSSWSKPIKIGNGWNGYNIAKH